MATEKSNIWLVILAFFTLYFVWGTTYLAIRWGVETFPPLLLAGVRFLSAGTLLMGFLLARGVPFPRLIEWRSALIIGSLLLLGGNGLVSIASKELPSSLIALIVATMPLWMQALDWLAFRGPRPTPQAIAGLLLGLVGIALLLDPDGFRTGRLHLPSILLVVWGPLLWAFGSLYSRRAPQAPQLLMATSAQLLMGGGIMLLVGLLLGEANAFDLAAVSTRSWGALAYLIVFGGIFVYPAYVWLLRVVAAPKVATYAYVNPAVAVFVGWWLAGEVITRRTLLASVVIIAAVVLVTTAQIKRPVPVEVEVGVG